MTRASRRPVFMPRALLRGWPSLRMIAALALLFAAPVQAYASAQGSSCTWGDDVPAAAHGQEPSVPDGASHAAAHLPTMSEDHRHDLDGTGGVAAVSVAPCGGSALIGATSDLPLTASTCQCVWNPTSPPGDPAAGDLFHPPRLS